MIKLFRHAVRLTDRRTRKRLFLSIPASVFLALLEAAALALLLPLVQVIVGGDTAELTRAFSRIGDVVGVESRSSLLLLVSILIVVLLLSKSALGAILTWWQLGVLTRGEANLAIDLFTTYVNAPYQFHVQRNSAEGIRNVNASTQTVFRSVLVPLTNLVSEGALIAGIALVLFVADPLLAGALAIYFGLVGGGYVWIFGTRTLRLGRESQRLAYQSLHQMQEGLAGVKAIQVSNREFGFVERFDHTRAEWQRVRHRTAFIAYAPQFFLEIALLFGAAGAAALITSTRPEDEALALMAFLLAGVFRAMPSIGRILTALNSAKGGAPAVENVHETLQWLAAWDLREQHSERPSQELPFHRQIAFEKVSYRYQSGPIVLREVDLTIARGESIGIVGRSGSGKTTLADLLLGLMTPTGGRITVDDTPLTPETVWSWREKVGYVPQDVFLADATLRRNIAFGVPENEIDEERVQLAIDSAELRSFVEQHPLGLDARVGERGVQLSGGQRQRVGIARALYRRPDVLVLDEATSALDTTTEAAIADTVARVRGTLTVVVIAHRLSTVSKCDRLILLGDGRVEGVGTFTELLNTNSSFSELVALSETRPDAAGPAGDTSPRLPRASQ